jgi:hypothetical protein
MLLFTYIYLHALFIFLLAIYIKGEVHGVDFNTRMLSLAIL